MFVLEDDPKLDAVLVEADSIDSASKKLRTDYLSCIAKVIYERIVHWNLEWSINKYAPLTIIT